MIALRILAGLVQGTPEITPQNPNGNGATNDGNDVSYDSFVEYVFTWGLDLLPSFVLLLVLIGVLVFLNRVLDQPSLADPSAGFRRQLVLLGVTAVGSLVVLLALPLSAERLNGVLTLIGLVVSAAMALAATTFVSNAMAGVMVRAVGNFAVGDFLKVGEHFGRVTERDLFHTEIQTEDRDLLTLPNLYLVTNPVKVVRRSGTILSAEVSLGYDVSRDKIEHLLVEAVEAAGLEEPHVHITELLDHAVVYRAAGLLRDVKQLISKRSNLRAAMLDALHGGGIEIVSPTFVRQRQIPLHEAGAVIPNTPQRQAGEAGANVEDVAFDKAEEVADLESLRQAYAAGEAELAELDAEPIPKPGTPERATFDDGRARLTSRLEALQRRIEQKVEEIDQEKK